MRLREISPIVVYHAWLNNCKHFECFLRTGPFATLKHYHDFEVSKCDENQSDVFNKILSIIEYADLTNTIIILDLPGEISIQEGFNLNNLKSIKPIPVINFLLHDFGLVGKESFVNNLVYCGLNLRDINPEGFAFLLDYNRYGDFTEEEYRSGFNNQYELFDENLPTIEFLRELDFGEIIYISEEMVKEDIVNYFQYLETEGIKVSKIFLNEVREYE